MDLDKKTKAKLQYRPKTHPINVLKTINVNGVGYCRNENQYLGLRVDNIFKAIKIAMKKVNFHIDELPKYRIINDNKIDIYVDNNVINISKRSIRIQSDDSLVILIIQEIGKILFNNKKFKHISEFRVINQHILKNRKTLKKYISGAYLLIPSKKKPYYLPRVHLHKFQLFVTQLFSHFIQDLFPEKTENETLNKIINAIKFAFI